VTIGQAALKLRAREVSAVELAQESLRRIRASQPELNAFITVTEDLALEQAARADEELARGIDRGPLHGIPYSLKDVFETRGIRTTCGSKIFADHVPSRDAAVYEKLREAGAVLMGKNNMHELAYGITSANPHFGAVRNPRDAARIPGGSSGGSGAAVAAGLVFFSVGSDTGGSIRIPAAYCGCVGMKPTSGRVSRFGVMPLDFSLDHMGPLARTVRDTALVLNAIEGFDRRDDTSSRRPAAEYLPDGDAGLAGRGLTGRRVGVPRNFFRERLATQVAAAYEDALRLAEKQGARLVEVTLPDPGEVNLVGRVILLSEASALIESIPMHRGDLGADVQALVDQGRMVPATDYINAQRLRRLYQQRWARVWDEMDLLFTPAVPIEAPLSGEATVGGEDVRLASTRLARPFNVMGWPALSFPLPVIGLPVGLQVVGRPFGEAEILSGAVAIFNESGIN